MSQIHFQNTEYGFEYGSAKITRLFSDPKKGWICLGLETPKYTGHNAFQLYVTKTGKVRVIETKGEWFLEDKKSPKRNSSKRRRR